MAEQRQISEWSAALHIARRIRKATLAGLQPDPHDCDQLVMIVLLEAGMDPMQPDQPLSPPPAAR